MDKTIILLHGKKVERNTSCKQWENLTIELYYLKTDGFV